VKAFVLSHAQIASVAAALTADTLGSEYGRHVDTLTAAGWSAETPLGEGGAELTPEEARACFSRICRFFGFPAQEIAAGEAEKLGDWVDRLQDAVSRNLLQFAFFAAGDGVSAVSHAADVIYDDAAAAANLLYGRRRIISLVSPHSLIGFALTVLAPNLLQAPAIDARGMAPAELKKFLAFGDALVATPSLWRYAVAQGVVAPDNAMAVFFGEPMSAELSAEIRKAGFGAQREIYGSTEDGLIAWRDSPSDPFALFDQWRRGGEGLMRRLPSGETVAISPMDALLWEGERRFRLGGRRDGAVQIGAVNVFPARISEKISEHPEVESCEVSISKNASGADRLIANIELKTGGRPSETTARSIDAWCRAKLRPYERPRLYAFIAPGK
jgi:4-coumarate--CoA ligase (photoactive yellow protein activation family)